MGDRSVWERMLDKAERERDEAEAVVRLLVETGGRCGARFDGAVELSCSLPFAQHDVHTMRGWFWTDTNPGATPSPFEPYRAALERITSGSAGTEGTTP